MSRRSGLAHDKLVPNDQTGIPGLTPQTDWNLVSVGPTGKGSVVLSGSYADNGQSIGPAKMITFTGHEEKYGTLADLGATRDCTLWIQNGSDTDVYYLIHTADEP
jgi:hypothetical protein